MPFVVELSTRFAWTCAFTESPVTSCVESPAAGVVVTRKRSYEPFSRTAPEETHSTVLSSALAVTLTRLPTRASLRARLPSDVLMPSVISVHVMPSSLSYHAMVSSASAGTSRSLQLLEPTAFTTGVSVTPTFNVEDVASAGAIDFSLYWPFCITGPSGDLVLAP